MALASLSRVLVACLVGQYYRNSVCDANSDIAVPDGQAVSRRLS